MMIRFSQELNCQASWFLPVLALLAVCIPAVAQQATVSAPLSADEVMRRVVEMNEHRANALESYSSIRSYHLECHCLSHKTADMVVRAEYDAPNKKVFTIVSESGSGTVRSRVFKKLLEAEQESMREENQERSAITPQNYTFQLTDYQKIDGNEYYVLEARPLTKNKFLFRGSIWVDAKTFETKVRVFGTAVLTIKYGEYQITKVHRSNAAFDVKEKLSHGQ